MTQEQRKVVLSDIASAARVHVSTVSLALRNSPKIAPDTRKRIQKIAEELNYRPDPQLLSLVAYRKRLKPQGYHASIAIVSDVHVSKTIEANPYYRGIEKGILEEAHANGFNPTFLQLGQDFHSDAQLDRILQSRGIRGIVFHSIYDPNTRFALDWDQYACIKINRFPEDLAFDSVSGNGLLATKLAFRYAMEAGYQRPALAVCADDEAHIDQRYESSFFMMQQSLKPENRIAPLVFPYSIGEALIETMTAWMNEVEPDVLLSNWGMDVCCFRFQQQTGRTIPFLHLELDPEHVTQPGVLPNNYGIGRKAVEMLTQKLNRFEYGLPESTTHVLVDPTWHEPEGSDSVPIEQGPAFDQGFVQPSAKQALPKASAR